MIWMMIGALSLTNIWETIVSFISSITDDFLSVVLQNIAEGFFDVFVTTFFVTFDSSLMFLLFGCVFLFAFYWKYIHGVVG